MQTAPYDKTILIVDDSEAEVELISIAIEDLKLPYRIDVAIHGQSALDYLYRRGKFANRPPACLALVILDNKMPVMGGIEALAEIRKDKSFRSVPIVMFTASAQEEDIIGAYDRGVNSYVVKPMGAKNFSDGVQTLVRYWTQYNVT